MRGHGRTNRRAGQAGRRRSRSRRRIDECVRRDMSQWKCHSPAERSRRVNRRRGGERSRRAHLGLALEREGRSCRSRLERRVGHGRVLAQGPPDPAIPDDTASIRIRVAVPAMTLGPSRAREAGSAGSTARVYGRARSSRRCKAADDNASARPWTRPGGGLPGARSTSSALPGIYSSWMRTGCTRLYRRFGRARRAAVAAASPVGSARRAREKMRIEDVGPAGHSHESAE